MPRTRITPNKEQAALLKRLDKQAATIAGLRDRIARIEQERDALIQQGRETGLSVAMLTESARIARETFYSRRKKVGR